MFQEIELKLLVHDFDHVVDLQVEGFMQDCINKLSAH